MSQFCPFHVVTIGNVAGFVECVREDCMAWMDGSCIRLTALMPLIGRIRNDHGRHQLHPSSCHSR